MRLLVQGLPGDRTENGVFFRTNDPTQLQSSIEGVVSRVNAGVTPVPTSVVFGTLNVDTESRAILDVFDSAKQPRSIDHVVSTKPESVVVSVLPVPNDAKRLQRRDLGTQIGQLEVTARTVRPGSLDADIEIHLSGDRRKPTAIAVSGRIAGVVEVSPSIVVLPRQSPDGLVYFASCSCRSTRGGELTLSVDSTPPRLVATVENGGANQSVKLVRIDFDPTSIDGAARTETRPVRLLASVNGEPSTPVEIPVMYLGKGNP
jgi:hypothetical protein